MYNVVEALLTKLSRFCKHGTDKLMQVRLMNAWISGSWQDACNMQELNAVHAWQSDGIRMREIYGQSQQERPKQLAQKLSTTLLRMH